jgi:hypothetical protein
MAKSLLDSEGIRYLAKGETLQDLFGVGRLGFGFSPVVGPVEIQVAQNDAEGARTVLSQLQETKPGPKLVDEGL